jgi:hypothetical protein
MEEFNEENFQKLISGLAIFEQELVQRGTKYFGGTLEHFLFVIIPTRVHSDLPFVHTRKRKTNDG